MISVSKRAALLLTIFEAILSLTMVNLAHTSVPKPSTPEFTVEVGDSKAIEVTIKNQPFISYYDANSGWNISLYYNIRVREHTEENWTDLYLIEDVPTQSNSDYTNLSYPLSDKNTNSYILGDKILEFPFSSQVDFQVKAMIGYIHRVLNPNATSQLDLYPYVFTGEESGWSNTQTITISESQTPTPSPATTPTPTPYNEPQQIEQEIIIGVAIAAAVIGAGLGLLIYLIKRK